MVFNLRQLLNEMIIIEVGQRPHHIEIIVLLGEHVKRRGEIHLGTNLVHNFNHVLLPRLDHLFHHGFLILRIRKFQEVDLLRTLNQQRMDINFINIKVDPLMGDRN
jgi:hypothetical protein